MNDTPKLPSIQAGGSVKAIVPQDFDSVFRIANAVVVAGMAPKGLETPEKATIAILHGLEVGMTPMMALQSIAVINGRATIWGDGAIGLIRASGKMEWIKEWTEGDGDNHAACCQVKRKNEPESTVYKFSIAQAKKANLWGKSGPWMTFPDRMLSVRPRSWALRDTFADVLRGLAITEEVQDFSEPRDITPTERPTPPKPPAPKRKDEPKAETRDECVTIDHTHEEVHEETAQNEPQETAGGDEPFDVTAFLDEIEEALAGSQDLETLEENWQTFDAEAVLEKSADDAKIALGIYKRHEKRIKGAK